MLTVFFGNDEDQVRKEAFLFVETYTHTGSLLTRIEALQYDESQIAAIMGSTSLFGESQVCCIDTLSEYAEAFGKMLRQAEGMAGSVNQFVIIERTLLVGQKKEFEKAGATLKEYKREKKETFNIFALTDAFVKRDKKNLWVMLQQAWKEGVPNEEIIGLLFWQAKMLLLAKKTKSADEAGQKPFVYDKAKRALAQYPNNDIERVTEELVQAYHDGHLGVRDTSLALEKWVLTL
jgi:DNA polymerase III delta subunit